MEIVYDGIRLTPERIAQSAEEEGVHLVGLSVLSGSHMDLVEEVFSALRERGLGTLPLIVGGIIPPEDARRLEALGVKAVYTPKDGDLDRIAHDILRFATEHADRPVPAIAG